MAHGVLPDDVEDVVFLMPGFMGFDRFGGLSYFTDRVTAILRVHLTASLGRTVPALSIGTAPLDELAMRQRYALDAMMRYCGHSKARIHLVGHSAGGVDAELLIHKKALKSMGHVELPLPSSVPLRDWTPDERAIRERIHSIVTLSTPHFGTTVSLSAMRNISEFSPKALLDPRSLWRFFYGFGDEIARHSVLEAEALGDLRPVLEFFWRVLSRHVLTEQLCPEYMYSLRDGQNPVDPALEKQVKIRCMATVVPPAQAYSHDCVRRRDAFFRFLDDCIREAGQRYMPFSSGLQNELEKNRRALLKIQPVISSRRLKELTFDLLDNDGIVNTAFQLLPERPEVTHGPLVIADHVDLIGHYDRHDVDGRVIREGIMTSGASFGDDQFFEVYRLAAQFIAASARTVPANPVLEVA